MSRREAAAVVWDAAAGLNERDRVLLDLHVRQGLTGQDLADAMGVRPNTASMAVNRLRSQVERALGALLVARLGHRDCTALQGVLAGWDGTFSPIIRKRVARHVDGCEVCSENRSRFTSPLALLATVPAIPAPASLRDRVLERVDLTAAANAPRDGIRVDQRGFPKGSGATTWKQVIAAIAVGGIAGSGAVMGFDALRSGPPAGGPTPVASPTTTPSSRAGDSVDPVDHAGRFTAFPGELPGELVENHVVLAIPLDGGEVTGTSIWSAATGDGSITHAYRWSGTFDADSGRLDGTVEVTLTLADGSRASGTLAWSATLDDGGVVTGSVTLTDDDGVIAFRATRVSGS